ncbi:MAG: 5-formyltetrahydrofolate cyclo-ligase [Chlamydiota bacterium]|nr:5-formyltetrahydrofolate cyclo-ligase [Chlamydiota bacterium]
MDKKSLRAIFQDKRKKISPDRRSEALAMALSDVESILVTHEYILSYSSFQDEFCTKKINALIAKQGKLLLPKVEGDQLKIFHVNNVNQLEKNSWGIDEPSSNLCLQINPEQVSCVFVPGLVFDINNHRIGYGKGFYDRFLCKLPKNSIYYGLGFKEQFLDKNIPSDPTDVPLSKVLLF